MSIDPEAIAHAVRSCPTVAGLSDVVATFLPGHEVHGVAIRERPQPEVEVHVIAWWGPATGEVAEQVRAAVHRVVPEAPVTVAIDDLELGRVDPQGGMSAVTDPQDGADGAA